MGEGGGRKKRLNVVLDGRDSGRIDTFLIPKEQGRQIRSSRPPYFVSRNTVENYTRNNDRCYTVPHCNTEQYNLQAYFLFSNYHSLERLIT